MAHDENLLFGVLAVQLRFVTPQALMEAAAAWSVNQEGTLREHLVRSGVIGEDTARLIAGLMTEKVKAHHGDVRATLTSFGGDRAVRESFAASSYLFTDMKPLESFGGVAGTSGSTMPPSASTAPRATAPAPSHASPLQASEEELEDHDHLTIEHPARYDVRGEHSRGGIGRVLVAFDAHIGREIAIKELLSDKAGKGPSLDSTDHRTQAAMARFLREARITGQLEHPSIVPVYELGKRPDGSIYYTMKFVRGRTMADAIAEARNFDARLKLLPHFLDLANAVSYAHSRGVIHRDLKPGNVMVGEFGETVVLDWGLAKVKGRTDGRMDTIEREIKLLKETSGFETSKGSPLGTPAYMSPEQTEGKLDQVDERSDVWSLGCVLYELLSGRVPFEGDLAFDIMGKVLTQHAPHLNAVEPAAPPELAAIAMKCLEKDPAKRYRNAEELKNDVENYMTGRLVSAYAYSTLALLGRWLKKWWPVAGTATAAILALIIVFAWSFVNIRREKTEALANIAEAYYAYGQWAESERRWGAALAYYGKALTMSDLVRTRYAINYVETSQPVPVEIAFVVRGHRAPVTAMAVSADGKIFASGDDSGEIRLTDLATINPLASLTGHSGKINALAFTADGNLISASSDHSARVWNRAGKIVSTLRAEDELIYLQPIGDGKFAAAGLEKIIYIVDEKSGKVVKRLTGHTDRMRGLALSPNGGLLLSFSRDKTSRVWEMPSGRLRFALRGHESTVGAGLFAENGKIAVTASFDKTIRGWSMDDGAETFKVETWGPPQEIHLVGEGKKLVAGLSTGLLQIVDVERGRGRRKYSAHEGEVARVIAIPGTDRFASAGGDMTVKIWDLESDKPLSVIQAQTDFVRELAVTPSGELLAAGGAEPVIRVWSIGGKSPIMSLDPFPAGLASSGRDESGNWAVIAGIGGGIKLLDVKAGSLIEPENGSTLSASVAVISPSGRLFATGTEPGMVHVFGAGGQRKYVIAAHTDKLIKMTFSRDDKILATASEDGKVMVWDTATGERRQIFEALVEPNSDSLAISPDGSLLATAARNGAVKEWELDGGRPLIKAGAHPDGARIVIYSPAGDKLVSAGQDGLIITWDPRDGREIFRFEAHAESVRCLDFSRDGKHLLSGGADQAVKSWDMKTGAMIAEVRVSDQPRAVAFRPDSGLAAAATRDGKVWLIDWRSGEIMHVLLGHRDSVEQVFFRGNTSLVSIDATSLILIRPFEATFLQDPPEEIYKKIVERTGIKIVGMDVKPASPVLPRP